MKGIDILIFDNDSRDIISKSHTNLFYGLETDPIMNTYFSNKARFPMMDYIMESLAAGIVEGETIHILDISDSDIWNENEVMPITLVVHVGIDAIEEYCE